MEHKPLQQLRDQAKIVELEELVAPSPRELRRMRLERLADVLAQHGGPVTLLTSAGSYDCRGRDCVRDRTLKIGLERVQWLIPRKRSTSSDCRVDFDRHEQEHRSPKLNNSFVDSRHDFSSFS